MCSRRSVQRMRSRLDMPCNFDPFSLLTATFFSTPIYLQIFILFKFIAGDFRENVLAAEINGNAEPDNNLISLQQPFLQMYSPEF